MERSSYLLSVAFIRSRADAKLFIHNSNGVVDYFLVYVDDIMLTGNNDEFLGRFISSLAYQFLLKDLGGLHHFLGVELIPLSSGLFLSQSQYLCDILSQFQMEGVKHVSTPMSKDVVLLPSGFAKVVDATRFRKLIGLLQYLSITRPDVAFAVNLLSQYMHAPGVAHWQAEKHLLRYLKGTCYFGLMLRSSAKLGLSSFVDSDWGGVTDGGRSTTTYVAYCGLKGCKIRE